MQSGGYSLGRHLRAMGQQSAYYSAYSMGLELYSVYFRSERL
ncbi:hypothetical protein [Alkalinema sp. FACHB-956]|nr:hypothetical protein [Alkalinema sp. FACHB-956]